MLRLCCRCNTTTTIAFIQTTTRLYLTPTLTCTQHPLITSVTTSSWKQQPSTRLLSTLQPTKHLSFQRPSKCRFQLSALAVAALLALATATFMNQHTDCSQRRSSNDAASKNLVMSLCRLMSEGASIELLNELIERNKSFFNINTPSTIGTRVIHVAAASGRVEYVQWVLDQGADVSVLDAYNGADRMEAELRGMSIQDLRTTRKLLMPAIQSDLPCVGWQALHYATATFQPDIAKLLLEKGADPEAEIEVSIESEKGEEKMEKLTCATMFKGKEEHLSVAQREKLAEIKLLLKVEKANLLRAQREERNKFPLEQKLSNVMVGQLMAIYSVSSAIRRRVNGWYDDTKPLVFMFLGSSGVGKTMLAKQLALFECGDSDNGFIRLDMTEYQSKHELSKMIGAPPGYTGYDAGGQLTKKLALNPNAVVLLDEIEKAHPDILTLLLQVFDEGRLTDGQGNTIYCPSAIFIMTSNLVQDEIRQAQDNGSTLFRPADLVKKQHRLATVELKQLQLEEEANQQPQEATNQQHFNLNIPNTTETVVPAPSLSLIEESELIDSDCIAAIAESTDQFIKNISHPILKQHFRRDEFIGRINDFIVFHPFTKDDLRSTVEHELNRWKRQAMERHSMELVFTEPLIESLESAYDERFGYRSIIYAVEKRVVNVLAVAHERGRISENDRVVLDVQDKRKVIISHIDKGQASIPTDFQEMSEKSKPSFSLSDWAKIIWENNRKPTEA